MSEKEVPETKVVYGIGIDISTTGFKFVLTNKGNDILDVVETKMLGVSRLFGQHAYDLSYLPEMFKTVIVLAREKGWIFGEVVRISICVRQHDLVVLDRGGNPLCFSLSWKCNAAEEEAAFLTREVGRFVHTVEPRFILPKLMWLLKRNPSLREHIGAVMTLEAYIGYKLTGIIKESASEALCNSLLGQTTRQKCTLAFERAKVDKKWFPEIIQSGEFLEKISADECTDSDWAEIVSALNGANFYAGLGDNHSTAIGCCLKDYDTVIFSVGTSGTRLRMVNPDFILAGKISRFEYHKKTLLLSMLPDCSSWYEKFVEDYGEGKSLSELDDLAMDAVANGETIVRVAGIGEYPPGFNELSLSVKVASVQASIAYEMLIGLPDMLNEVVDAKAPAIKKVVLTGGLSRSPYFRNVFETGLFFMNPDLELHIGSAPGKLVFHTAGLGALLNALAGGSIDRLWQLMDMLCPTKKFEMEAGEATDYYSFCEKMFSGLRSMVEIKV